jgi:hypothetical protein
MGTDGTGPQEAAAVRQAIIAAEVRASGPSR